MIKSIIKKTTVGLLTFILLAAVLLTGCGKTKTDSSNEDISITFMNQDDTLGVVKLQSGTKLSKESYTSYENLDGAEFKGWYETPSFIESSKKDLENEAFSKDTTLYGDFRTSDVTEDTHKWYIAGSSEKGSLKLNNWAAELSDEEKEQFELKPTGKQTNEFAITIDLFVGDEYQLISDWSWDNQLGYGRFTELDASQMENAGGFGGTDETANVKVAADGKYTITLITNPDNPAQIQISVVRISDADTKS